ncbi:hypothetical protein L3X38_042670 [Prunus dulcis]|uniref:Uncharacterized protein n=1 Tax=Prunus dulcis TaxID=3755 RepID=A0AAD4YLR7_PRUDU|nr:hypothetical protein L3X38_042670 [Prunus dulcis]
MGGSKQTRSKTIVMAQTTTSSGHHSVAAMRMSHAAAEAMTHPHNAAATIVAPATAPAPPLSLVIESFTSLRTALQPQGHIDGAIAPSHDHLAASTAAAPHLGHMHHHQAW